MDRRLTARALLAVPLALLFGCTIRQGDQRLLHADPRSPEFWSTAEELEQSHDAQRGRYWALPGWFALDSIRADAATRTARSIDALAIGPFIGVPLFGSLTERVDRAAGPSGRRSTLLTPFSVTTDDADWPAGDEPLLRASGFPLLWTSLTGEPEIHVEGAREGGSATTGSFRHVATLLNLGPSFFHLEADASESGEPVARVGMFTPLALGGLGMLLWNSLSVDTEDADVEMHGPLFGSLGYLGVESREDDGDVDVGLVLLGTLWTSIEDRDEDAGEFALHGPLWGMLGWGKLDGEPVIRVLWIPIPI